MQQKKYNLVTALKEITNQYGFEIYQNPQRVNAMVLDLVNGDTREKYRKRFKIALESGVVEVLLQYAKTKENLIDYQKEAVNILTKNKMDFKAANEVVMAITAGLGLYEIEEVQSKTTMKEKRKFFKKKELIYLGILGFSLIYSLLSGIKGLQLAVFITIIGVSVMKFIAKLLDEFLLIEQCKTMTIGISIGILFNKLFVSNEVFYFLAMILTILAFLNCFYCWKEVEDEWMIPNIIFAIISMIFIFLGEINLISYLWQWMIGIGGGLCLLVIIFVISELFEQFLFEFQYVCSTLLTIYTIVNVILWNQYQANYEIILVSIMLCMMIASLCNAVKSWLEVSYGVMIYSVLIAIFHIMFIIWKCFII